METKTMETPNKKDHHTRNKNHSNNIMNTEPIESYSIDNFYKMVFQTYKEEEKDFNNKNHNYYLLLQNIIQILEKLVITFKDEKKLLYNILKEVYISIYLLIMEFIPDFNKKIDLSNLSSFLTEENNDEENIASNEEIKGNELDINSKVVFLLKIKILNRKISSLNKELKTLKKIIYNNSPENKNNNYYEFMIKKLKELKNKIKIDEFKYLFYINSQKKKIMELEDQLKTKRYENLSKEDLKSIRCFPNFVQYNFKEDINLKSLPLSQYLKMESKHNSKSSYIRKNIKKSFSSKNKLLIKNIYKDNNKSEKNFNIEKEKENEVIIDDKLKTDINNKTDDIMNIKRNNIINIKNNFIIYGKKRNSSNFNFDFLLDSDFLKKHYETINPAEKILFENKIKKLFINKNILDEIKRFKPNTLINNKKEFFIAHPTLKIAGVHKGKEQVYSGLPKKLLNLSKGGSFKSARMIFPSSLNETMVNLEKLRINKLHIDMDKKENED